MAKIVCVEDEPGLREDLVETLELAGHTVIEAENGQLGLEAILREGPDLVISDITMPVMDGLGLLAEIRSGHKEFADMPFILLSALADRRDQIKGHEHGADEYLTKPVDFELMHVVINGKLRQVQRMQEKKDQQLLKMYGALTKMPVLENQPALQNSAAGICLNIVLVADEAIDSAAACSAIKSAGHAVHYLKSGQQFLDALDSLEIDLLVIAFNTADLRAPGVVKQLQAKGKDDFVKILIMPQASTPFPAMGKLPHFDAHLTEPLDCQELMQQIDAISLRLKYSADLLRTA